MDKPTLRERIWDELEESGEARFPFPPHGRIPNFAGADEAAERLADQPEWEDATTVKANPDAPQLPVRRRALRAGKTLYMAQPRLRDERPFLRLDPAEVSDIDEATTVSGVSDHGVPVGPEEMPAIDLIVSGSVAVTEDGARIGKGEGYSDLEFAVLRELDLVNDDTPTATTVHGMQVVDEDVDIEPHDVPMHLIVTPERTIRPEPSQKPAGIDWSLLSEDRLDEIPVLRGLEDE
ncbi:5-formyltetrahydrofolate cyclo-ligase [Halalkalicoccus salilacus]|uniref:5-formyltetrahydrofolate cyclo-ligase n=1 Tax=Halalkalicoccus salilacus TaxID=3117459 RepID=UPI00300EB161